MNRIKNIITSRCVYFPFIGWFITLIINHDDELLLHHIKQSFAIALVFTAGLIVLGFMLTLTQRDGFLRIVLTIIIYLVYLLYFALSAVGTRALFHSERLVFPLIGGRAEKLNI
ncbi:MAG: hypothetical protein LBT84_01235 [Spirochaetia bacterium]|jgi:uncharacterized membrane protein|nr:hypothetical protein [Spirochaetia bacterium]